MREEVYWAGYKTIHEFESTEAIILGASTEDTGLFPGLGRSHMPPSN